MKKIILLISICFLFTACGGIKDESKPSDGKWEVVLAEKQINFDEEELSVFNSAIENYYYMELEPVALLGKQEAIGTNYMFLVKGDKTSYKVVVVNEDFEGNTAITHLSDLDFTEYTNDKNITNDLTTTMDKWVVSSPDNINAINDEKISSTLAESSYIPIAIVGKKISLGTTYAVLCYGKSSPESIDDAIYLVTVYENTNGNQEIISQVYIDINEFN